MPVQLKRYISSQPCRLVYVCEWGPYVLSSAYNLNLLSLLRNHRRQLSARSKEQGVNLPAFEQPKTCGGSKAWQGLATSELKHPLPLQSTNFIALVTTFRSKFLSRRMIANHEQKTIPSLRQHDNTISPSKSR